MGSCLKRYHKRGRNDKNKKRKRRRSCRDICVFALCLHSWKRTAIGILEKRDRQRQTIFFSQLSLLLFYLFFNKYYLFIYYYLPSYLPSCFLLKISKFLFIKRFMTLFFTNSTWQLHLSLSCVETSLCVLCIIISKTRRRSFTIMISVKNLLISLSPIHIIYYY